MIKSWNMKRGNKSVVSVYTNAYAARTTARRGNLDVLFVTEAKPLNVISLRVPAHANMFVAIGGDNVSLIGC